MKTIKQLTDLKESLLLERQAIKTEFSQFYKGKYKTLHYDKWNIDHKRNLNLFSNAYLSIRLKNIYFKLNHVNQLLFNKQLKG